MMKFPGFKIDNNALFDFVLAFPEPAHIKDLSTRKYICSNQHNLKVYGLDKPEQIVGLTVHDLDGFMKPYWGDGFADQIDVFDDIILNKNNTFTDKNRIFLDKFGLMHVQDMTKVPVLNYRNEVFAILTTSFDITNRISRFAIFEKYKAIYKKKREACLYFMKHIKINMFFSDILSEKEIMCLLYMTENHTHKNLTQRMKIANKTVESHISNIVNKLKSRTLNEILEFLRSTNQYGGD
jgi:DNA-binding CsgD family transcriptional regulator